MAENRFIADGYRITQSVEIGGMEIVLADNPEATQPYMTWRRSLDKPFGAEEHLLPIFGSDYTKILREFIRTQSACADSLALDQAYRGSALEDHPLDAGDCVADGMKGHLDGKVVAIRPDILLPEYRRLSHQLMLATGGFGCSPGARGRAVFGANIYSGGQERWDRADILGVVAENTLPAWAREKLAALRAPAEKESVIDKIREAKAAAKTDPPTERQSKNQNKTGPEL